MSKGDEEEQKEDGYGKEDHVKDDEGEGNDEEGDQCAFN